MRTILVLNTKGGSGKTTVATNIAGYFASTGKQVALADFDPQRSSLDWLAARSEAFAPITGIDAVNNAVRTPQDTEYLILDAPAGTHGAELEKLVKRAQTMVIPVAPSPVDIRAAVHFLDELRGLRQAVTTNVKIATIANRVRENGVRTGELEDYLYDQRQLDGHKLPFLASLRAHSNYLRAAERGLSIFEFAPAATEHDREQWLPLVRWLKSSRSVP